MTFKNEKKYLFVLVENNQLNKYNQPSCFSFFFHLKAKLFTKTVVIIIQNV